MTFEDNMTDTEISNKIANAPKRDRTLEIRIQALKYFHSHNESTGKEFVEIAQIQDSYFAEADKMKVMLPHLIKAGLDPEKL